MQTIKFRAFLKNKKFIVDVVAICFNRYITWDDGRHTREIEPSPLYEVEGIDDVELMQFTGLLDKNGKEIWEGDILEFTDKWEWYRGQYGIKMMFASDEKKEILRKEYENEPMERRVIEMPDCYEWILSSEIQTYWAVIGNRFENPELLSN